MKIVFLNLCLVLVYLYVFSMGCPRVEGLTLELCLPAA